MVRGLVELAVQERRYGDACAAVDRALRAVERLDPEDDPGPLEFSGIHALGLWVEAGLAKGGKPLRLRCLTFSGDPLRASEDVLLQAQLAKAGIRLELIARRMATVWDWVYDGNFDIADFAWIGNPFVLSGSQETYQTDGSGNPGGFSDPTVDDLFQRATGELDPARAADLGNEIDRRLWAQLPSIPLYQPPGFLA